MTDARHPSYKAAAEAVDMHHASIMRSSHRRALGHAVALRERLDQLIDRLESIDPEAATSTAASLLPSTESLATTAHGIIEAVARLRAANEHGAMLRTLAEAAEMRATVTLVDEDITPESVLTVDGRTYPVPERTDDGSTIAPGRIYQALHHAGWRKIRVVEQTPTAITYVVERVQP